MNEIALINMLVNTTEFKHIQKIGLRLNRHQRKFDLLTLFEELIDEMAWSRLFAYLLDSTKNHGLNKSVLSRISENINEFADIYKLLSAEETNTICLTEWMTENGRRIDILIKIIDTNGIVKAIIGIETKIHSGEQNDQIRDYQRSLIETYPHVPKSIIYLTPDGRTSSTSDCNTDCSVVTMSFESIANACKCVGKNTKGQGKLFLSVLKNHIAKITKKQIMDDKVIQHINRLYLDANYRQAIKLISQYAPNTRNLFEKLSHKLGQSGGLSFTIDKVDYYPRNSPYPHEFKIYIKELKDLYESSGYIPCYILHCDNLNPDFGDIFTLRIALWDKSPNISDRSLRNDLRKKVQSNFSFQNSQGSDKHWSQWICIWTGGSYMLSDLGKEDINGLEELLLKGISHTFTELEQGLKRVA
jgi:hypothetical protein